MKCYLSVFYLLFLLTANALEQKSMNGLCGQTDYYSYPISLSLQRIGGVGPKNCTYTLEVSYAEGFLINFKEVHVSSPSHLNIYNGENVMSPLLKSNFGSYTKLQSTGDYVTFEFLDLFNNLESTLFEAIITQYYDDGASFRFECSPGVYIRYSLKNDGVENCPDGSDEITPAITESDNFTWAYIKIALYVTVPLVSFIVFAIAFYIRYKKRNSMQQNSTVVAGGVLIPPQSAFTATIPAGVNYPRQPDLPPSYTSLGPQNQYGLNLQTQYSPQS